VVFSGRIKIDSIPSALLLPRPLVFAMGVVLPILAGLCSCGCAGPAGGRLIRVGQEAGGPWWMAQTALTGRGTLRLTDRPWWPRALQLAVGESFTLDAEAGPARMLVRRERVRNRSREVEAIVWVIDDDEDGSVVTGGDADSDCYVVDYGPDGVVDRMVDYIDNDGDGDADEMDIRYFAEGMLRQLWCGLDLDDDDAMWDLAGYEYSGDFFKSDPSGDGMIYMNKFDPERGVWVPISECPFAFYDTDGDGFSEVVVRVSVVPMDYDVGESPDYANDVRRYRGRWTPAMRQMAVANIRYSFDVDNVSGPETPLHYDFGFNLVGSVPYPEGGTAYFNPKRRPPQVTRVIPHAQVRALADRYAARETGFSWQEQHDDTVAIGAPPHVELDFRWEGVFWIWQRRFMSNTGGPNQRYNVRREWSGRPSSARELYYSGVDRRIHLFGAEEGWIEVGHFAGLGRIGEIRMADTDGNGYFDRWEVRLGNDPAAVRVTTVRDEKVRRVRLDEKALQVFYTQQVLPEAMAATTKLMAAMRTIRRFDPPPGLVEAMHTGCAGYRRFAQDVACELQYQDLRRHLEAVAQRALAQADMNDLRKLGPRPRRETINSETAWRLARLLQALDTAYGQGDIDRACELISQLRVVAELFEQGTKAGSEGDT